MANAGDIYLGVSGDMVLLSPYGRKYSEGDIEIGKSERTASGRLVKDVVTSKKVFKFSYEIIDGDALIDLLALYAIQDELILWIQHTDDSATTTEAPGTNYDEYTVLMEPIPERARLLAVNSGLWENAVVTLNEV